VLRRSAPDLPASVETRALEGGLALLLAQYAPALQRTADELEAAAQRVDTRLRAVDVGSADKLARSVAAVDTLVRQVPMQVLR
jgi:hypothetical protein